MQPKWHGKPYRSLYNSPVACPCIASPAWPSCMRPQLTRLTISEISRTLLEFYFIIIYLIYLFLVILTGSRMGRSSPSLIFFSLQWSSSGPCLGIPNLRSSGGYMHAWGVSCKFIQRWRRMINHSSPNWRDKPSMALGIWAAIVTKILEIRVPQWP